MDIIKKTLQFGVGMFSMGKDTVTTLGKDLKKKYDLDEETSKKIAKDMIDKSVGSQKDFACLVRKHVIEVLDEYKVIRKDKKAKSKAKSAAKKAPAKNVKKTAKKKATKK